MTAAAITFVLAVAAGILTAVDGHVVGLFVIAITSMLSLGFLVQRWSSRMLAPPLLVALAYTSTALVGVQGSSGALLRSRTETIVLIGSLCGAGAYAVGYALQRRPTRGDDRVSSFGLSDASMSILTRLLLLVCGLGAAYHFRHGVPVFGAVQNLRFVESGGSLDKLAATAYSLSFLIFLLLLPRIVHGPKRPWLEFVVLCGLVALEGNRRFVMLALVLLLFLIWSHAHLHAFTTAIAMVAIIVGFLFVGFWRATQNPEQALAYSRFLQAAHFSGPQWIAPGYFALHTSAEVDQLVIRTPQLALAPDRPFPISLGTILGYAPGHQVSPDFWLRTQLAPNSDPRSGLAVPLVAALYLDGSWVGLVLGFFILGSATAICRYRGTVMELRLVGVAITCGAVLGVYGTFLGTPQFALAVFGLLLLAATSRQLAPRRPLSLPSGEWTTQRARL